MRQHLRCDPLGARGKTGRSGGSSVDLGNPGPVWLAALTDVMTSTTHVIRTITRALLLAAALGPSALGAQIVRVTVVTPEGGPMQGALVTLVDTAGVRRAGGFSNGAGQLSIHAPGPGRFSIRAELVGRATVSSPPRDLAASDTVDHRLVGGERTGGRLRAVEIVDTTRCVTKTETGATTAALWEEIAKALRAAAFAEENRILDFMLATHSRLRSTKRNYREERVDTMMVSASHPFSARTPAELAQKGYVEAEGDEIIYHAPDHAALLSDEFIREHCFSTVRGKGADRDLVGLAFEPLAGREQPDVRGVFWIDPEVSELRRLEYTYTGLDPAFTIKDGGGRLHFRRLATGAWIITQWSIRMPVVDMPVPGGRRKKPDVVGINEAGGRVLQTFVRSAPPPTS